jgi:hypothetical protein
MNGVRRWKCVNCQDVFPSRLELYRHKVKCAPSKSVSTAPTVERCTCFTGNAVSTDDGPRYEYGLCEQHEGNCW